MTKKSRWALVVAVVALAVVSAVALVGCGRGDPDYFKEVSAYTFWDNEASESIPQYQAYHMVKAHLEDHSDGKIKKVAVLGVDGCRADMMLNVCFNDRETSGYVADMRYSGINKLRSTGGLYLAYTGGEYGTDTQQEPSTQPGWASVLTGGWHTHHGVTHNGKEYPLKDSVDTVLMEYAKKGIPTSFTSAWLEHFTETYAGEIAYLKKHDEVPLVYTHTKDDEGTQAILLDRVRNSSSDGREIVFGIYDSCDDNGHSYLFGNDKPQNGYAMRYCDTMAYEVMQAIEARATYEQEDWLILMLTDHGGWKWGHGQHSYEERTIWMACNKPIDPSYFGKGYDGHTENS